MCLNCWAEKKKYKCRHFNQKNFRTQSNQPKKVNSKNLNSLQHILDAKKIKKNVCI